MSGVTSMRDISSPEKAGDAETKKKSAGIIRGKYFFDLNTTIFTSSAQGKGPDQANNPILIGIRFKFGGKKGLARSFLGAKMQV